MFVRQLFLNFKKKKSFIFQTFWYDSKENGINDVTQDVTIRFEIYSLGGKKNWFLMH